MALHFVQTYSRGLTTERYHRRPYLLDSFTSDFMRGPCSAQRPISVRVTGPSSMRFDSRISVHPRLTFPVGESSLSDHRGLVYTGLYFTRPLPINPNRHEPKRNPSEAIRTNHTVYLSSHRPCSMMMVAYLRRTNTTHSPPFSPLVR